MLGLSGQRTNQRMGVDLTIYVEKFMEEMNVKYSVQAVKSGAAILKKTAIICTQINDLVHGTPQPKARKEKERELIGEDLGVRKKGSISIPWKSR